MDKLDQARAPFVEAIKKYIEEDISPFDVPGHHMGNVDNQMTNLIGKAPYKADINAPVGLDNLAHPDGVILEAENLMADVCHADNAYFLINGTSSGLQAAILALCKPDDKIILPRNVHKSITNSLVLSGVSPLYVSPQIDTNLEIANQPTIEDYKKMIIHYPSAKAVVVINPTYFGVIMDLKKLVDIAHAHNMAVIVDEAHGAHYYFSNSGPINAMDAGADVAAVSFHKTGGSLTQSSALLIKGDRVSPSRVQETLNLINTTSPSPLLMGSLDAARSWMALNGEESYKKIVELAKYAFENISKINGFKPRGKEYFKDRGSYDYDKTKLLIELDKLDLTGYEVYKMLKNKYHIQIELAENYVILCVLALGNTKAHIDNLIKALKDISKNNYNKNHKYPEHTFNYVYGYMLTSPRTAYFAPFKSVPLEESINHIARESVMIYPPGIPIVLPGEVITKDIISQIKDGQKKSCTFLANHKSCEFIDIVDETKWRRFPFYEKKLVDFVDKRMTNPRADEYHLPFEGDKHSGTIVLLPYRNDVWRNNAKAALKEFINVIKAIAEFETVYVGIHPTMYDKYLSSLENIVNVIPLKVRYNDSWARDNTLVYLLDKNNKKIRSVDFRFNAWGGEVDGLYTNYKDDDALGRALTRKLGIESYYIPKFILEGGSIATNGKGTLITTEACLLSKGRNPSYTKIEIEEELKTYLGVNDVIWLPRGIIGDETNEHVDNFVAFASENVILLSWPSTKDKEQYKWASRAYDILVKAKDYKGDNFEVIKVKQPYDLKITKEEAKGIKKSKHGAKPRIIGDVLCASYINFYQGDKYVILPQFGIKEDETALRQFKNIFPSKEIIPVYSREILIGGGNIHCITMQIPEYEKK
jgi:lysine decarboxylase